MNTANKHIDPCLYPKQMQFFLEGRLSKEETEKVELHLTSCELCCKALEEIEQSMLKDKGNPLTFEAAHEIFSDSLQELKEPSMQSKRNAPFYRYAAILIALLIPTYFLFFDGSSNQDLAEQYFTPYEDVLSVRSGESSISDELAEAMLEYNNGNYKSAIEKFEQVKDVEYNILLNFYMGICHLAINNSEKAIVELTKVREALNSSLSAQASWYLSLAYLQNDEKKQALHLLKEIEEESTYFEKAQQLFQDLD